ncbi:MAG: hypothetical protein LIO65_08730, partial [Odoribacter sp.]|nr:hypothetical protein [Odoribacter sp.]
NNCMCHQTGIKNNMKKIGLLFLINLILVATSWGKYSGYVYINNQNKTLSGVAVSDGLHVTLTDKNGFFHYPDTNAKNLFLLLHLLAIKQKKRITYL